MTLSRRRAVSEVVAAVILLAVISASSFLALNSTSKQITENQNSVHDALESKGSKILEAVSIISKKSSGNTITIELLNYGLKDIMITEVLVDGADSQYTVVDYSGANQDNRITRNKILSLQIPKSGQTVQIITNTKNMLMITM